MPFQRPTLAGLVDRAQQDFVSRLELNGAVLRRSVVRVLSRVVAGAAHMLHGHLDWGARQLFADTAEEDALVRQAALYGVDRKPAAYAYGSVDITGEDGTVIPLDTRLIRADGVVYVVDSEGTIDAGTASVSAATLLAGAEGNADEGVALSFESPVAGADAGALVGAGGISGGADEEDVEALRGRLVARLRSSPQGGTASDYVTWALEVPGVTRAWVYPREMGAGTVILRFVRDDDASLIPDSGEVATVQAYVDALRPATAAVTVAAPVAAPLAFTLAVVPNTTAVKAAVEAELEDLLRREASPGAALPISRIRTAIGNADGLTDYTLTTPSATVSPSAGQLITLGVITWA